MSKQSPPVEQAEEWVNHCLYLIISRKEREVQEFMEEQLKKALSLLPEIDPEVL